MRDEELKELIQDAVSESLRRDEIRGLVHDGVVEALKTMGVDAQNPIDVQKDMQFVRELRLTSEKVKHRTIFTLLGILLTGIAAATWIGLKDLIAR